MIKLDKLYFSEQVSRGYDFEYDKKNRKRPSWLKFKDIPENVQFVKILVDGESFWYRYIFGNYFFVLEPKLNDIEIFYDYIAKEYDKTVPQNKEIAKFFIDKLNRLKINKNSSIMELCAGTGLIAELIYKKGFNNFTLVDISANCLKEAKKKIPKCKIIKNNVVYFRTNKKYNIIYESMGFDVNFDDNELELILVKIKKFLKNKGIFMAVDRHIYPEYWKVFKKHEKGYFYLDTSVGKYRYDYFIGMK